MKSNNRIFHKRVAALKRKLRDNDLDAIVVSDRANAFYLSGLSSSNSLVLITSQQALFLTDFRYIEKATQMVTHLEVKQVGQGLLSEVVKILKKSSPNRIGFESNLPYQSFQLLAKGLGMKRLIPASEILSALRAVKDENEVSIISANQKLNQRIWRQAIEATQTGESELSIRRRIRIALDEEQAEEAFSTIVATGPNSSLPHAEPGTRKLRKGEYLLIDMGVRKAHYHSDMTRTVGWGTPSPRHREIYNLVLDAQKQALAIIKPGIAAREVDAVARNIISSAGYGEAFQHGLGHGVGLEIHEGPTLNARSNDVLQAGHVVTVEPGIYIPGFGGVRIEDLVVVTKDGYRNLTSAPKIYREL